MKKKVFLILFSIIFLATCAIFYLNQVILPKKIKSLVIHSLQDATQKKVTLDSVRFNIFKGLVLRDLAIYDAEQQIVSVKESTCTFLILPVFKGNIILNSIKLESPVVYLERLPDNSFNLAQLFTRKETNPKFSVFIRKLSVNNGLINFKDDTLPSPFTKSFKNVSASIYFLLPASIKFNLKCGISSGEEGKISSSGIYDLTSNKLSAKILVDNLPAGEFIAYYANTGISIRQGLIDCLADLTLENNTVSVRADMKARGFDFLKDKIEVKANSDIIADIKYDLKEKRLSFRGDAGVAQSGISGLDIIGEISDIKGRLSFDNNALYSDKITANIAGFPVEAKLSLANFTNPAINIAVSGLDLDLAQKSIKDKLRLAVPAEIKGNAELLVLIQSDLFPEGRERISGIIDLKGARVKLDKVDSPIEEVKGKIEFDTEQVRWPGMDFKYQGVAYRSEGALVNFAAPQVQLKLSSKSISLESELSIKDKVVELARLTGRYLNSGFSLKGRINTADVQTSKAYVQGELDVDLKDLNEPLKRFQNQLEQIRPDGVVHAKFNIEGDISDFKSCAIDAQFSSPALSVYGLKTTDVVLSCKQEGGILEVPSLLMSMYEGTLNASCAINLTSVNLPFWINLGIKDVKIEKLKLDTALKQKDIAGIIQAQAKINGFSDDLSRLSGQGNIAITDGKLWQLDLFKGIGKLIFAEDFANIIFNEGYCGFVIGDRSISTDSLKLKSSLVEMDGSAKIGFDNTVDASIRIHVLDQMAPLTSTLKDIATAIIGQSGSLGLIKISGTLQNPKFKFQPAIVDIIKGLKDSVLGNIF